MIVGARRFGGLIEVATPWRSLHGSSVVPPQWPVPDALFADPRLARIYDLVDGDRGDLDAYVAMVDEFGAAVVLDIGCGTGTFACLLAARGKTVVAVDPARASLAVARRKPHAGAVQWITGDATVLPRLEADVVTMTGNCAQVFLTDDDWGATLRCAHRALRPGGVLVFETRDPDREAWRNWTRVATRRRVSVGNGVFVETWEELTEVNRPLVSFRSTYVFEPEGTVLTSTSTLRFRDEEEVRLSLTTAGFVVEEVRDAPDRPGQELVFVSRTPAGSP